MDRLAKLLFSLKRLSGSRDCVIGVAAAYLPAHQNRGPPRIALLVKWLLERRQVGEWRKYVRLPPVAPQQQPLGDALTRSAYHSKAVLIVSCRHFG